jgi:hypothetical protein
MEEESSRTSGLTWLHLEARGNISVLQNTIRRDYTDQDGHIDVETLENTNSQGHKNEEELLCRVCR